ncbi:ABC transporter substrate-binding protein [Afifella marina]|uniref:Putative thiamine transport system substrate-binding protein n=1 Tax=Afifella marina DSM 2698 TaxID=1120955 RepID=A0A1G5M493_AFIMA|nr:ABC transporter substrate-binding protein [Afifella marina]MBK1622998.1 ABC transporter substrate-binding protein [Afifella marina DSM 2698]MBK1625992.1 ABC transporter substrate-binding protein [Afifella marina]MBK5917816.1 ABC transporter substrate-binding protein [Afifella marina]RAI18240.1 ABC transporter substrate-binding protein [Afifella marina DSM 2698]SCZ20003.1 putative thiamine transport system substrate-binding protein [Afifella marina DSM 2698]
MSRIFAAVFALIFAATAHAESPDPENWEAVLAEAKGETVYFHAWGGETRINAYIAWAAGEVKERFGVTLKQVKVADTANVVSKIVAEKAAGRDENGTVDLVWINGENFVSLKEAGLLLDRPWATKLPNYRFVDEEGKPTVKTDFTVPTDGLEAPWGMAKLVFFYDTARLENPPKSMPALLEWAKANPGRFTYPQPPDFLGSTFLKQALYELAPDPEVLMQAADDETFARQTKPLFAFLDELHPLLWRQGRAFPQNYGTLRRLLADSEVDITFAFNPADASSAIAAHELPDTVRSYVPEAGSIANSHFLAIPFNANAKAGAMVVANFLMSPEAQARKQDPNVWGDPTVLDVDALPQEDRARFDALDLGVATLPPEDLGKALPEPHASWMERLETEWARRYRAGQ